MRKVSQQKTRAIVAMCTKTKALQIGNLPEPPFTFGSFTDEVGRRDASSLGTIVLRWLAPSNWTLDVAQIRNGLPPPNYVQPEIRNRLLTPNRPGPDKDTSLQLLSYFAIKYSGYIGHVINNS